MSLVYRTTDPLAAKWEDSEGYVHNLNGQTVTVNGPFAPGSAFLSVDFPDIGLLDYPAKPDEIKEA